MRPSDCVWEEGEWGLHGRGDGVACEREQAGQ